MIYTREILNRKTGELETINLGDWITIAELGGLYGFGRRQTTEVLRKVDVLQVETHERTTRHRLADWFVEREFGMRQKRKIDKYPFDVIGPKGQEWIDGVWELAVADIHQEKIAVPVATARAALDAFDHDRDEMTVQMEVCWLADHFPCLTQAQMALVLSVSQPLINRNLKIRQRHLMKANALKNRVLQEGKQLGWNSEVDDPDWRSSIFDEI